MSSGDAPSGDMSAEAQSILPPKSDLQASLRDKIVSHQQKAALEEEAQQTYAPIEYIVLVRLFAIQTTVYKALLLDHAPAIEAFCDNPTESAPMHELLRKLEQVCTHPGLISDDMPSTQMSEYDEAWYLVQSSSKFELLVELIEALRHQPVTLGVACSQGARRLLKIIFRGLRIRQTDPDIELADVSTQDASIGEAEVILLNDAIPRNVDLLIALEDTTLTFSRPTPMLRLMAPNTVEHAKREHAHLLSLVTAVTMLHEQTGSCATNVHDIVQRVTQFLCGEPLELDPLPALQTSSSLAKRKREDEEPVRPRILVTQIDGIEVHTEEPLTLSAFKSDAVATEPAQFISPFNLERRPSLLPTETISIWPRKTPDEERIAVLEADIERMMDRFDDLREECRVLGEQKEEAILQAATLQKRFERVLEEARQAKNDRSDLRQEIQKLQMPPLPEESAPEYLQVENTRLKSELERAKKSTESKAQDFEFVRQQYQQSSSAAAELSAEVTDLKAQVALLQNRQEGGLGYKLAVAQAQVARQAAQDEARELSLRNNVLIEQLRRMRDDRQAVRGRDRTRASSAQEVSTRKRVEKGGPSPLARLSVAALMSPAEPQVPLSSAAPVAVHPGKSQLGQVSSTSQTPPLRASPRHRFVQMNRSRTPF
ncbi:hypothetical protein BCR37DRAFT_381822 [Protomyces lactucae-debilis]|uniref:Uncharacterized protein n=1 Tax=Protomyces lactucae-debilis TaxID=2754530 RepID=A0A1Y2F650_PROLT|nr:uncharacterized protein BCR37DRAFT_381822 [Protomyces lactucae-debilis]ORY78954.1 hypothetical protein BCR37DRAFT_381822 [Protomyces lactucae-debilis]